MALRSPARTVALASHAAVLEDECHGSNAKIPRMRLARRIIICAAIVPLALAASCSSDEPDIIEPVGTSAPSTSAEDQAKADIAAVYDDYWAAVIASENGPTADRALFEGIAIDVALEAQIRRVERMIDNGVKRSGEPEIGKPHITVNGDTARVEACVNQDSWSSTVEGSTPEAQSSGPRPMLVDLRMVEGNWYVSAAVPQKEATLTC